MSMIWLEISYDNKGEKGVRSLLPGPPARDRDLLSDASCAQRTHRL